MKQDTSAVAGTGIVSVAVLRHGRGVIRRHKGGETATKLMGHSSAGSIAQMVHGDRSQAWGPSKELPLFRSNIEEKEYIYEGEGIGPFGAQPRVGVIWEVSVGVLSLPCAGANHPLGFPRQDRHPSTSKRRRGRPDERRHQRPQVPVWGEDRTVDPLAFGMGQRKHNEVPASAQKVDEFVFPLLFLHVEKPLTGHNDSTSQGASAPVTPQGMIGGRCGGQKLIASKPQFERVDEVFQGAIEPA